MIGIVRDWPSLRLAGEHRARRGDLEATGWHRNVRPAFFWSAPGQEAGLAEHLEAVADADDRPARLGEARDRTHDRREAGDRTRPQVVPVGETAWEHDRVEPDDVGSWCQT